MKHFPVPAYFAAFAAIALFFGAYAIQQPAQAQSSSGNITGYAWSDVPNGNPSGDQGAGWISFSGIAQDGKSYNVSEDSAGTLSGYAWSSNVGWISFNASDVSGCPSGTCQAQVNQSTGAVTGWARAIEPVAEGGTLGNAAWSGWIDLSGTAQDGSSYGVTVNSTSPCAWSGYAWGGNVMGWISFSGTAQDGSSYGVQGCAATTATAPSAALTATGCTLSGSSCNVNVSFTYQNTSGNAIDISVTPPGGTESDLYPNQSPSGGSLNNPESVAGTYTYKAYNPGTYPNNPLYTTTATVAAACASNYGQACTSSSANICGMTNGTIACNGSCTPPSNSLCTSCTSAPNSCGMTNTGYIVNGVCNATTPSDSLCSNAPTTCSTSYSSTQCYFYPSKTSVLQGAYTTLYWGCPASAGYVSSQGDSYYSTNGVLVGNQNVVPYAPQTTYTLTCYTASGHSTGNATVSVIQSTAKLWCSSGCTSQQPPYRITKGDTATISWTTKGMSTKPPCSLTANGAAFGSGNSGQNSMVIDGQTVFTLSCNSGALSTSTTINVLPTYQEL